jgi:hypothetical protein
MRITRILKFHTLLCQGCDLSTSLVGVDAVCINQGNNEERGQQVQLMAKIYSKATRVLVWLGETGANSDKALLEIVRIAAEHESLDSLNDGKIQQAILALLKRPWFQRIWVSKETLITMRKSD